MFARTNRSYNERGSSTNYVRSSIPHCISVLLFTRGYLRTVLINSHHIGIGQQVRLITNKAGKDVGEYCFGLVKGVIQELSSSG
jgi:hypothetical protein